MTKRKVEGEILVTNADVNDFLKINFDDRLENIDYELVRDILTVGRLYDRNFTRIRMADKKGLMMRKSQHQTIENLLSRASAEMRNIAGIRAKESKSRKELRGH